MQHLALISQEQTFQNSGYIATPKPFLYLFPWVTKRALDLPLLIRYPSAVRLDQLDGLVDVLQHLHDPATAGALAPVTTKVLL